MDKSRVEREPRIPTLGASSSPLPVFTGANNNNSLIIIAGGVVGTKGFSTDCLQVTSH